MSMLRLAEMKGSFTLVASALTASTAAFTSSASDSPKDLSASAHPYSYSKQVQCSQSKANVDSSVASEEKFAPRFDGLRFIETLVTAHR